MSKDAALRRRTCRVNLNRKFTGFTHSDKETGFLAESANHNQVFKGKTRFLAIRASAFKETGFLAESTHHNQELSKKPGFWPPARQP
jgi:hypothetical protein